VHIDRDSFSAKFWLSPVALADNLGFPARELRKLETLTSKYQKELLEAWKDYFGIYSRCASQGRARYWRRNQC
jgi:hypothetical protein